MGFVYFEGLAQSSFDFFQVIEEQLDKNRTKSSILQTAQMKWLEFRYSSNFPSIRRIELEFIRIYRNKNLCKKIEIEMEKIPIKTFKVEYVSFNSKCLSPNGTCSVNQSIWRGKNKSAEENGHFKLKSNQIKKFSRLIVIAYVFSLCFI